VTVIVVRRWNIIKRLYDSMQEVLNAEMKISRVYKTLRQNQSAAKQWFDGGQTTTPDDLERFAQWMRDTGMLSMLVASSTSSLVKRKNPTTTTNHRTGYTSA